MKKIKSTRQLTLFTLCVALGVAVYLNWQYAKTDLGLSTQTGVGVAETQVQPTQAEEFVQTTEGANKNYGDAQLVAATVSSQAYFDQVRLNRSKVRDAALDAIQKTLRSAKITDAEKTAATASLTETISNMTLENDIENIIKAKGFIDCIAFIDNGKITVTVMSPSGQLTSAEVTQIRDIVINKAGIDAQNINIVEVK